MTAERARDAVLFAGLRARERKCARRRPRLRLAACCALLALVACEREPPAHPADPQTPELRAERSALATVGPVATAAAFDLVLGPSGPLLVWAQPRAAGGAVMLRELDRFGEPRGPARPLSTERSDVLELAAAQAGGTLGVIQRDATEQRVRTSVLLVDLASNEAPSSREPLVLASAPAELAEGRGRIAIAAGAGGRLRVMYMAGRADCADASEVEPCVGFAFRELGAGAAAARQEPWLSVPAPCSEGAVSIAGLEQRFFYSVCSWRGDAPFTMAYAINVENYYARADEVLRGCAPLGMAAVDADTVLLGGDCGVLRKAARLTVDMKPAAEFPLADLALTCQDDAPVLAAAGWALPLRAPRAELESILPEAIAPAGARALWTGSVLLVAQRMSGSLELRRYTCAAGKLHRG